MKNDMTAGDPARVYVRGEPDDPLAAEVFETILSRGGPVGTMHRVLAAAPEILSANYNFAITLRQKTKVTREFIELIILRTAQLEGAEYPFEAHRPMALNEGLSDAQIMALSEWRDSGLFTSHQRAVLAYADALAARTTVPDGIFQALLDLFDAREIVELTMASAFYAAVSRMSCGFDMTPGT